MNTKHRLSIIICTIKLCTLMLGFFLLGFHYSTTQKLPWFDVPIAQPEEIREAFAAEQDINAYNENGMTGLMLATQRGEVSIVQLLLSLGANVHLKSLRPDNLTALHFAVINTLAEGVIIARSLIDYFASARARGSNGYMPHHYVGLIIPLERKMYLTDLLIKHGGDVNAQTYLGNTLLHLVVEQKNRYWLPAYLAAYGSLLDFGLRNDQGMTAAEYADSLRYFDLAEMIRTYRVTPLIGERDPLGLTPLMIALLRHDRIAMDRLLKEGADVNARSADAYRATALHHAVYQEDTDAIALLLQRGARLLQNNRGNTPVHEVVRIVETPVRIAYATLLLDRYPEAINQQNNDGNTIIHLAVLMNDAAFLSYLLNRYRKVVSVRILNSNRLTPADLAIRLNHEPLKKLIEGYLQ